MTVVRLTAAQATVRFLAAQVTVVDGVTLPYFAAAWAIFGHGNVAGLGEALHAARERLPTLRAHNEQGMAHAAIAFAKQLRRRRAMICTSSIGPGATNMVTAAALAHVNRLPVLFLPGDVFAGRAPDPVLQQIEDFGDATVSANDVFRPVSRLFDRIVRPEQLLDALPRAMTVLTDPAACGPVTLALCQDVQAEAFDFPERFFAEREWRQRRVRPDIGEVEALAAMIGQARAPLLICGGGVRYSGAEDALARFCADRAMPFAETQAGKGAIPWDHPMNLGAIGVTGTEPANAAAREADLIVGVGTRLQDFTTGSRALFPNARLAQVNVAAFDANKHGALAVIGDARSVLDELSEHVPSNAPDPRGAAITREKAQWVEVNERLTLPPADGALPTDAQVIGAVWRAAREDAVIVCAAGGLPGELHKLWRTRASGGYHVEYGYSCMGYEIAGGLGVKMAEPSRDVHVVVGDGSYLMMNSELATSVMLGHKLIVTLLDNRGYGCIDRLQRSTGAASFNNLFDTAERARAVSVDFVLHARSLGAIAEKVSSIAELEDALGRARASDRSHVVVIETDPAAGTAEGGCWWDVPVPEVSENPAVGAAHRGYEERIAARRSGDD
jgi:3D-(3,5/4)-trihydroxycyclohexane-1,2-dione acylhydrolase (decyclizing)